MSDKPEAAKKSEIEAAVRVGQTAMRDDQVEKIKAAIGDRNPVLVTVHAEEEAEVRNKLPLAYAEELGHRLGLDVDGDIVQSHRIRHTEAAAAVRIASRTGFAGPVAPGRDYFLVDDMAVQGGTLADLRSRIEAGGGNVIGATTLMGAKYSHIFGPRILTLAKLRAKFSDVENWWKEQFVHGFDAITESEAQYLLKFRTAESLRNRVLEGGQAGNLSAAASPKRGADFWEGEGDGLRQIRRLNDEGKTVQEMAAFRARRGHL